MLIEIPNILTPQEVALCKGRLAQGPWADGRLTAGDQAGRSKANLQLPVDSPLALELGDLVLRALARSDDYTTAALPLRVLPPMFNRYDPGMTFGLHTDNALRMLPGGQRLRADVSTTIFLNDPQDYDGGELIIEDSFATRAVKLPAGHAVVYPASSLHRVAPVTRGSRWASFFWAQSMVRSDEQRRMLYDLDQSIRDVRARIGDDTPGALGLVGHYHNLLRTWAEL